MARDGIKKCPKNKSIKKCWNRPAGCQGCQRWNDIKKGIIFNGELV